MRERTSELEWWKDLHRRATVTFRAAAAGVVDLEAATPAGHWLAQDVIEHVQVEHGQDDVSNQEVAMLQMLTLDLAVHSWDLQRSQGWEVDLELELCLALHTAFEPYTHLMAKDGAFAPPRTVPHDASPTTRLIALTGRDPAWRRRGSGHIPSRRV